MVAECCHGRQISLRLISRLRSVSDAKEVSRAAPCAESGLACRRQNELSVRGRLKVAICTSSISIPKLRRALTSIHRCGYQRYDRSYCGFRRRSSPFDPHRIHSRVGQQAQSPGLQKRIVNSKYLQNLNELPSPALIPHTSSRWR